MKSRLILSENCRTVELVADNEADRIIFGGMTDQAPVAHHSSDIVGNIGIRLVYEGHHSNRKISKIELDFANFRASERDRDA